MNTIEGPANDPRPTREALEKLYRHPGAFADAWYEHQLRLPTSNTVNPSDILIHFLAGWDAAMKYKEGK